MNTSSEDGENSVVPRAIDFALCMRALRSSISVSAALGMSTRRRSARRRAMATATTTTTRTTARARPVGARRGARAARATARARGASRDDAAKVDNATGTRAGRRAEAARALASAMVALHASASVAWAGEGTYVARLTPTKAGAGASGEVEFALETNRANQEVVVVRANVKGLTAGEAWDQRARERGRERVRRRGGVHGKEL